MAESSDRDRELRIPLGRNRARFFYLDEGYISEETCLGIIFRYRSGGCRAVGHVLGGLSSRVYSNSTHFLVGSIFNCTTLEFLPVPGADKPQDHNDDDDAEKDAERRSKYKPMRGTLCLYTRYVIRKMKVEAHIEVADEQTYPGTAAVGE